MEASEQHCRSDDGGGREEDVVGGCDQSGVEDVERFL